MADIITANGVTYDGKETMDVLLKPAFQNPALNQMFRIITGIKSKQKLYTLDPIAKIVKKYQGCGLNITGNGVNIGQKYIETKEMEVYLEECADAFKGIIFEEWLKSGVDGNDLTGTQVQKLIEKLVMEGISQDTFRIAWFGDETSIDPNYNQMDGFWKLIYENVEEYCITKVDDIPDGPLGQDAALGYLKNLYERCSNILKQVPENQKDFKVTGSIYDNLLSSYESKNGGTSEIQFKMITDGVTSLQYRGINVMPLRSWDTIIESDFAGTDPHRIVYGAKDNLVLGVEKESDFTKSKFWYSDDDDMNKILVRFKMGAQLVHCDLTAASY
jgi:hypothetical protein